MLAAVLAIKVVVIPVIIIISYFIYWQIKISIINIIIFIQVYSFAMVFMKKVKLEKKINSIIWKEC